MNLVTQLLGFACGVGRINGAHPSPFDTSIKFDYLFLICTGIGITPGISVISQYCYSKASRSEAFHELGRYGEGLQHMHLTVAYVGTRLRAASSHPTRSYELGYGAGCCR